VPAALHLLDPTAEEAGRPAAAGEPAEPGGRP
jgi:hypothetical protein